MAATTQPASGPELLALFSRSVRGVAARLSPPVTSRRIANELLRDHDYGAAGLLPLEERPAPERPLHEWLSLIAGLYDRRAVARTRSEVIDGRLLLLGLARIDEEWSDFLRTSGLRWTLERGLGFPLDAVLVRWARPAAATRVVGYAANEHPLGAACAFSPDGLLLATVGDDGFLRIWDVAVGALVKEVAVSDELSSCEFSRDGRVLAAAHSDGTLRVWQRDGLVELPGSPGSVPGLTAHALSPDGRRLAATSEDGAVQVRDIALPESVVSLGAHRGPAWDCAFTLDGLVLATAGADGCLLWDVRAGTQRGALADHGPLRRCSFSPDPESPLLATLSESDGIALWRMPHGTHVADLPRAGDPYSAFVFSPDGRLLAAANPAGETHIWDVAGAAGAPPLVIARPPVAGGEAEALAFSSDGRLLATRDDSGVTSLWDVASANRTARLELRGGAARALAFSPEGGVLATVSEGGSVELWEEIAPPRLLPAVAPDSPHGPDLLGAAADADALANLIAASATQPPLSIGLFGDWGSGKTFLINQIRDRIRRLARRSQQVPGSAYCAYVRNIEFNAWHYADANLWASLVTHIFNELAKPEPAAGVDDEQQAREQVARLEERLAAESELHVRLDRARVRSKQAEDRKKLLELTSGLAGLDADAPLAMAEARITGGISWLRLALPKYRRGVLVSAVAVVFGCAVFALLWAFDVAAVIQALAALGGFVASAAAGAKVVSRQIGTLVTRVGETAKVADVRTSSIDAELEAARVRQLALEEELAELQTGRRLARFAAERRDSDVYRTQLGLVWRVYQDFTRMTELLAAQRASTDETRPAAPAAPPETSGPPTLWARIRAWLGAAAIAPAAAETPEPPDSANANAELPQIDRIVLYIDDLDRCAPKRVVEVLEAVHLILALKLFVVVLAVDPRWLTQSLDLHYSQLLGGERDVRGDDDQRPAAEATLRAAGATADAKPDRQDNGDEPIVTPINYLEKIIQIPFALRPMGQAGGSALVKSLLPVTLDDGDPVQPAGPEAGPAAGNPHDPAAQKKKPHKGRVHAAAPHGGLGVPSLSPRPLALTPAERDFAAYVAPILRTPRAVKKFTNLYRLLRAGLDDASGELDRFLHDDGKNVPEYEAALILLAVVIRFPEDASEFLGAIGDLGPDAPMDERPWKDYVEAAQPQHLQAFVAAGTEHARNNETSTREPFRRLALGVSRYSFDTGQTVFARYYEKASL